MNIAINDQNLKSKKIELGENKIENYSKYNDTTATHFVMEKAKEMALNMDILSVPPGVTVKLD